MPALRVPARWWGAWCAVVFLLFNSCAGHRATEEISNRLGSAHYQLSFGLALDALRALGTDDGDINRYLAYVNAVLGRPYQGYYVRPLEGWRAEASTLSTGKDVNDPMETPPLRPATPLAPYRDFLVEYPPGFFLFAIPPALPGLEMDGYRIVLSCFMALLLSFALLCCVGILRRIAPERVETLVRWSVGMALALGTISVRRYDAAVSLSLCGLALGCVARRPALAGVAFGVGVAAKGLPLLLAPLPILYWISTRRRRELAVASLAAAATGLAIALPFVPAAGARMLDVFAYHGQRPLQVESTGGALLIVSRVLAASSVGLSRTYGSTNAVADWDAPLRLIAGVLPPAALAAVAVWTWAHLRRSGDDRAVAIVLLRALCAALVALMTLGKVFSPQYLIWLLPLGTLVSVLDGRSARLQLLAALVLTQLIYPLAYRVGFANSLHPAFGLLVLARNGLLIVWAARLLRATAAAPDPSTVRPAPAAT